MADEARDLVRGWAERAEGIYRDQSSDTGYFEAFIFAWMSFNGWASRCTGTESDSVIVDVLSVQPSLVATFNEVVVGDDDVRRSLDRFRAQWPIFKAADVRNVANYDDPRSVRIEKYLAIEPGWSANHGATSCTTTVVPTTGVTHSEPSTVCETICFMARRRRRATLRGATGTGRS